jgi:hypothetical protein
MQEKREEELDICERFFTYVNARKREEELHKMKIALMY